MVVDDVCCLNEETTDVRRAKPWKIVWERRGSRAEREMLDLESSECWEGLHKKATDFELMCVPDDPCMEYLPTFGSFMG